MHSCNDIWKQTIQGKMWPAYSQNRKLKIFLWMTHDTTAEVEQWVKWINTEISKTYMSLLGPTKKDQRYINMKKKNCKYGKLLKVWSERK